MHWEFIVLLVIAIPIIFLPVVFAWYLDIGGIVKAIREARARRTAQRKNTGTVTGAR